MITFGKKMNFRPLVISLAYFLLASLIAWDVLAIVNSQNKNWAWVIGFIFFALIAFGYYPNVLPIEFNYCEISAKKIRYYDHGSYWNRIKMIFLGKASPLKEIATSEVVDAKFLGTKSLVKMAPTIFYPMILIYFVGIISSVNNLCGFQLKLADGQEITLSLSRDKIYEPEKTINQSEKALELINQGYTLSKS